jgi:parallel beta-helix repeat protein
MSGMSNFIKVRALFVIALIGTLGLAVRIQRVQALGTTYIRANGSVEGTPYIVTDDNVTYVFIANINDSIVIERNNIVINGKGYTVQGSGSAAGFLLSNVNNVTVKNANIMGFYYGVELKWTDHSVLCENNIANNYDHGVHLYYSSNNNISGNKLTNNSNHGVRLYYSSNNSISGNSITDNYHDGVHLSGSSNNSIYRNGIRANEDDGVHISVSSDHNSVSGNKIGNNENGIDLRGSQNNVSGNDISNSTACGIWLGIIGYSSDNNSISGNSVENNSYGISLFCADYNEIFVNNITASSICGIYFNLSENNRIFHNNFVDNTQQAYVEKSEWNSWDDDYPSGGNFWNDCNPPDSNSDQIGDMPRTINGSEEDRYPLIYPFEFYSPSFVPTTDLNNDNVVNTVDISVLAKSFGSEPGDLNWSPMVDMDINEIINIIDMARVAKDFGKTSQTRAQWNKTCGGTGDEYAESLIQTDDGGYALAGRTNSLGAGLLDFWLVKIDAAGNVQWNKTYGGTGDEYAMTLIQTDDGGYALAGSGWLVKTDTNGDMIWNRTYLAGSYNCNVEYVVQTDDGGYALAGNTRAYGDDDFCLVKTDYEGKVLWNKTYTKSSKDGVLSLIQTGDGGYALAGYTEGQIRPRFYLIKTDADGNRLWNHTFGTGNGHYVAYSVVQTNDGGYALAGDNSTWIGGSLMTRHCYFVKVGANGNFEWEMEYGGTGVAAAYSAIQTYNNGFALAGYKAPSVAGNRDCYLVRIDARGALLWENTYGGKLDDMTHSVVQTNDRGYALAGQTRSFGAGGWDFWIVKTDEEGCSSGGFNP